jgi:hypothetical protein
MGHIATYKVLSIYCNIFSSFFVAKLSLVLVQFQILDSIITNNDVFVPVSQRCEEKKREKEVFLSPGKSEHISAVFVDITTIDIFYKKWLKHTIET